MVFIDQATILVKAGDGGRGCVAFAQPPYTRYPSPDGGDGGDGGHVILRADPNVATLLDFQYRHEFTGQRGAHGGGNGKTGKRGDDLEILVPVGTVVHDEATGDVLVDLARAGERVIIAQGGRGGLGNATTAAAARQAYQRKTRGGRPVQHAKRAKIEAAQVEATSGSPGEERRLTLELKLIADVGIIGRPNAGKSSLLKRISTAHPKVAAYPFTTRYPVLGVVDVGGKGQFVACDIPGLIEGAHAGKGLGMQFLRHIERTRLLVHVVDAAGVDGQDPVKAVEQIGRELEAYGHGLEEKPQMLVANKVDLPEGQANVQRLAKATGEKAWPISCATGQGIPELLEAIRKRLKTMDTTG